MRMFKRWINGVRGLLFKTRVEKELDAEVQEYLEEVIERKMSDGLSRADAQRAARAEIGSLEAIKDGVRDVGWETALESVWHDVRYAGRTLVRSRGFTVVTVLTLALGIGANAAVFSIAHAIMLQPLPYAAPEGLVALIPAQKGQPGTPEPISFPTYRDWRNQSRTFASMAAYVLAGVTLTGQGDADSLVTCAVTSNVFSLLGVAPLLGRTMATDDDSTAAGRVVVISEPFWRDRLGARSNVIGQRLILDGEGFTVIGVMPSSFKFPNVTPTPQVWMPLAQFQSFRPLLDVRMAPFLNAIARLRSDRDMSSAQSEMDAIAGRLRAEHPAVFREQFVRVVPLQQQVLGDARMSVLVVMGGVGLLLVIACTNVASLQLARTIARGRDLAVRTALGASRFRLARQLLIESLLLAVCGGALGLGFARAGLQMLSTQILAELPQVREVRLDLWVLGFTFVVSCASGILFGLLPVFGSRRIGRGGQLRDGVRGATPDRQTARAQNLLVVLEVSLAMVMLTSAGLLIRTLTHLHRADAGFEYVGIVTGTVNLPQSKYDNRDQWMAFNEQLLARVRRLPDVTDAAFAVAAPFLGVPVTIPLEIDGGRGEAPRPPTTGEVTFASDGYFKTMRIPLLRGREFAPSDTRQSPRVGIVNTSFARRHFGEASPIGRKVLFGAPNGIAVEGVGVVGDTAQSSLVTPPPALLYIPYAQRPFWITSFVMRTSGDQERLGAAFRRAVAEISPDVPVLGVEPMAALLRRSFAASTHRATFLALFSVLAVTLAAIGLYGLIAYTVAKRTGEIGIRLALGADRGRIRWLVLQHGFRLTIVGITLGLAISLAVTRLLATLLFGVSATDPATFVSVGVLLMVATAAACYIPARRAMGIDPLNALRCE